MSKSNLTRRGLLKTGAVAGSGLALPTIFTAQSASAFTNDPTGGTVTLGFNVPQTGPYADEGNDELLAQQLAVEHLNGEGDGGCLNTFSSKALQGNGILGKKVTFVTGDTQTKSDAARASAKSMIEKDGAIMINGGSSSGVAVAVQGLCHEAGIMFMAGLTHSNDTTGKDRSANGFRHFFNAYMSGAALAPVLAKEMGSDRRAYHLTADYTWGWTQEESIVASTEAIGWEDGQHRQDPARLDRLLVLHRAGSELGRRRAGPEPLRRQHGQLSDQRGSVRPARQAGERQGLQDRRSALFGTDGRRRRREHQGRARFDELQLAAR